MGGFGTKRGHLIVAPSRSGRISVAQHLWSRRLRRICFLSSTLQFVSSGCRPCCLSCPGSPPLRAHAAVTGRDDERRLGRSSVISETANTSTLLAEITHISGLQAANKHPGARPPRAVCNVHWSSKMLDERALWSTAPPEPRSRLENWPTVLFSWWCTSFAAVIIITRLCGRKVRSNQLFREDWIMMISLIPLFIRMIFIHFVLIYGTNNVDAVGHTYSPTKINHKEIGSRLVLAARIFYAMFIWISKLTVSEFLKRITIRVWRRSWEIMLQIIRIFLFLTFASVVIATLTECQPFDHYWQVVPDPGPHCRQGFAQLLTMGICDIITDILLIAFPIPVVLNSGQTWKRKTQMVLLFSMSIIMIGITATRMPMVIGHHGRQQYRTVWASCEILASASVSNAVILGSFLRDKGTKKNKYKTFSVLDSIDRTSTRRPTLATLQTIDSDEDLFRTLGVRIPDHLQNKKDTTPRPAPPAEAAPTSPLHHPQEHLRSPIDARVEESSSIGSSDSLHKPPIHQVIPPSPSTTRSVSFFDVGNLLDHNERSRGLPRSGAIDEEIGPHTIVSQDFANPTRHHHSRSEARAFLRDVGERLRVRGDVRDRSVSPR